MRSILLCVALLIACGRPKHSTRDASIVSAPVDVAIAAEEEMPAMAPPMEPAPEADLRAFASGVEGLAWRLWPTERARPGNRVYSPAAVSLSLAMAASVTRGSAADEVREALGPGLDEVRFHHAAGTYLRAWQSDVSDVSGLLTAQRVFAARGVRFEEPIAARLRAVYGAPTGAIDTAGPEGARRRINAFAAERARGAVAELVPEYSIVGDAPAIVGSAAHARFVCAGEVGSMSFRVGGVAAVEGRSAVCRGAISSARGEGFTLLRVPGSAGTVNLDVVLPDEGLRLADLEARLNVGALRAAIGGLRTIRTEVNIPTVVVANDSANGLRNSLMEIGVGSLFDPERSELARPAERGGWISELFHRARFDIDVAPDGAAPGPRAPSVQVDRPFVFVLRDARFDTVLALGHVVDPG